MSGMGTRDEVLISTLCPLANSEVAEIAADYKAQYGRDLRDEIKGETTGKYEDLMCAIVQPKAYYLAKRLRDALKGAGSDDEIIIAILCTADNELLASIKTEYSKKFGRSLEDDLQSDYTGDLDRLFTMLIQARRDAETTPVDPAQVDADVEAFYKAAKGFGTDETTFMRLLCSRSRKHLAAVAARYPQLKKGKELDDVIKSEFKGKLEDALRYLLIGSIRMGKMVAKLIRHAIKGVGTNDELLIVAVAMHHDTSAMRDAIIEYEEKYGKSMAAAIKGDTTGNFEAALLSCCHLA
eukprot:gnl/Ergobibamus_cyprinoides/791.p2 GENE.gnl/Ergobibamus_cyprinoides/791~~gnl/Ergobibamus_cyprinoides/791.p2  ORF type:complete len:316 (+),score=174.20 gnl/Ergobibamus_cyprinoides/791:65-949(+)